VRLCYKNAVLLLIIEGLWKRFKASALFLIFH